MDAIDLTDYVCGGYFIAKPIQREAWMSAELLPETIISLSTCRNKSKVQIVWAWDIEKYIVPIRELGINKDKLSEFKAWGQSETIGHPNVFYSLEAAQDFIKKFTLNTKDFSVFGIGLLHHLVSEFLADNQQTMYYQETDVSRNTLYGTNLVLSQMISLDKNGIPLGFEILSYDYSDLSHSWLCNYLEREMFNLFGIRPNQYGLIQTYDDAIQVYDWIAEDKLQGARAEPEPYYPWLIVQYPIM